MALKKDQSTLPAAVEKIGMSPDSAPRFITKLAEAWYADYLGERDTHVRSGNLYNASWASSRCARALAYNIARTEASNPPELSASWRMGLGSLVHDALQEVLPRAFPGADIEVKVSLTGIDNAESRIDIVIREPEPQPWVTVIELKTINGFGYKMAVGARGAAEGPRFGAIVQGALGAHALDADELVIGYLSLECLSQREADKVGLDDIGKFAAEWSFDKEQIEALAMGEYARVNRVLELMNAPVHVPDADALVQNAGPKGVPRAISDPETPKGARVTDPMTGAWQVVQVTPDGDRQVLNAGKTWMCGYCWHRDTCLADGA